MKVITTDNIDFQIYFDDVLDYEGGKLSIIVWKNNNARNTKKELRNKVGIQCARGGTIGMFSKAKTFERSIRDIPIEYHRAILFAFFQFQRAGSINRYEALY